MFYLDKNIDSGRMIYQSKIKIKKNENSNSLLKKINFELSKLTQKHKISQIILRLSKITQKLLIQKKEL